MKTLIVIRSKTARSHMNNVEHNTTGTLLQHLPGQGSLLSTRPGPGAEIGQLRIQGGLINSDQNNIIWSWYRTTQLEKQLPPCRVGANESW